MTLKDYISDYKRPARGERVVLYAAITFLLVLIVLAGIGISTSKGESPPQPPPEQYRGHIDPRNIHNGVTAFQITSVSGDKIDCIVIAGWGRNPAYALSCDWSNR